MNVTETLQLANPGWLWLLPPLWLIGWLYRARHRRDSAWRRLCDPVLLARMSEAATAEPAKPRVLWPLLTVFTLGIFAASGPGWRSLPGPLMESASARIIVLDLSRAMLVEDIKPSRHGQAVAAAREIIAAQFEGETGLVVFAGAAFKVAPLSRDVKTLLAFLDALEPGIMPVDGARLDLAIDSARDLLSASVFGQGQIIVLTAGGDDIAAAADAAARARDEGHEVSIMAVGSKAGGPLIGADGSLLRDASGRQLLARTDYAALDRVARAGNGVMIPLQQSAGRDLLLQTRVEAATLVESDSEAGQSQQVANEGYWLVWILLPAALILFRKNLICVLLIGVCLPPLKPASAADFDSPWRHREQRAYAAYVERDFAAAAELSRAPMLKGAAAYRQGRFDEALALFSQADNAPALYNRGNSLVQLERYDEAVAAFSRALEFDPGFAAARFNRRLVELYLQQAEAEAAVNDDSGETSADDEALDSMRQPVNPGRIGIVGQELANPADRQQSDSAYGALLQSGNIDPFEQFDGSEQAPDRFALREGIDPQSAQQIFDRWIETLPTTASDLFERKFLRDYQRQRRQPR